MHSSSTATLVIFFFSLAVLLVLATTTKAAATTTATSNSHSHIITEFPSKSFAAELQERNSNSTDGNNNDNELSKRIHSEFYKLLHDSPLTIVVLANHACGSCAALRPMLERAAEKISQQQHHQLQPRFVWVDCDPVKTRTAQLFCLDESVFPKISQYPSISAFVNDTTAAALRIDGEDGLKPIVNPISGKAVEHPEAEKIDGVVKQEQEQQQQQKQQPQKQEQHAEEEEEEEQEDDTTRWTPSRLVLRIQTLANPVQMLSNETTAIKNMADLTRIAQQLTGGTTFGDEEASEPQVHVVAYVPRSKSNSKGDLAGCSGSGSVITAVEHDLSSSSSSSSCLFDGRDILMKQCVSILEDNQTYVQSLQQAAAYFAVTQQYLFVLNPSEKSMAELMATTVVQSTDHDAAKGDAVVVASTSNVTVVDSNNGVVSSFVAEHRNDLTLHAAAPGGPCRFTSRAVLGIFSCSEFAIDEVLSDPKNESSPMRRRRLCRHRTVRWSWMPRTTVELVDFLIENARPTVTVVSTADAERFYPGAIIEQTRTKKQATSPSLSEILARPFAFDTESAHLGRTLHLGHDHLSQHASEHGVGKHAHTDSDDGTFIIANHIEKQRQQKKMVTNSNEQPQTAAATRPPIFAFFVSTQSCKGRPDEFWYALRRLERIAPDFRNTTFAVYDSLRFSEYYLRAGLTRPVVEKLRLGMAIFDSAGRKFNVLSALEARNWTRDWDLVEMARGVRGSLKSTQLEFSPDVARLFLEQFWAGKVRPHGKVEKGGGGGSSSSVMRLKTARRVLEFFGAKQQQQQQEQQQKEEQPQGQQKEPNNETVQQQQHEQEQQQKQKSKPLNLSISGHSFRILLVESPNKDLSRHIYSALSLLGKESVRLRQEQEEKSNSISSSNETDDDTDDDDEKEAKVFLGRSFFAAVNGEGRGALATEYLWPQRRSSLLPFIVCAAVFEREAKQEDHQHRVFVSAPSFVEFERNRADEFASVRDVAEHSQLLLEWIGEKCDI